MSRVSTFVASATALLLVVGCSYGEGAARSPAVGAPVPEIDTLKILYVRPGEIPFPTDNAYSDEKRALGHALFFDPRLSKTGTISCASCHNPGLSWSDGLAFGLGHRANKLRRHSPTILDVAWAPTLFWDGRAETLETQAVEPMLAEAEMGMTETRLLERINAAPGYQPMFKAAFPDSEISLATIAAAIATFERTVVSERAPFDRWIEGDEGAIGESAKRGFVAFNTKANCAVCHSGWRFTDDGFHDIGLAGRDKGRGEVVKDVAELQHAFKTPTLRNVSRSAPYMHDGSIKTLEGAVRHYEGAFVKRKSLSPNMRAIALTDQERADVLAFLQTLTSNDPPTTVPILPN